MNLKCPYRAVVDTTVDSTATLSIVLEESEESYLPDWADNSLYSYDCLNMVFPLDEAILEAMSGRDKICEYLHHRSYFLPELSGIENQEFHLRLAEYFDLPINPLPKEGIFVEENMENIYVTIPINIFANSNIVENVHIGANYSSEEIAIYISLFKEFCDVFSWSYKEMSVIDTSIVEHEI